MKMSDETYVWHGDFWCRQQERHAWKDYQNPAERAEVQAEVETMARAQDRTVVALIDHGFTRNRYRFLAKSGRWIEPGEGWYRRGKKYTGKEAVEILNKLAAASDCTDIEDVRRKARKAGG